MKIIAMIPSRYGSSRFPGKPLALICGKPMIQHVYEKVLKAKGIDTVYVATDDQRIYDCVTSFDGKALMTSEKHTCGSDRLNECREKLNLSDEDIILNIQGDEPLICPEMIEELLPAFNDSNVYMATLKKKIEDESEINNHNVVKLVSDVLGNALYFSRYPIPYNRDGIEGAVYYKHVGTYGYKAGFLKKYSEMQKSFLEKTESLEQLRVLENGFKIKVVETMYQTVGVDTEEQLKEVEKFIKEK